MSRRPAFCLNLAAICLLACKPQWPAVAWDECWVEDCTSSSDGLDSGASSTTSGPAASTGGPSASGEGDASGASGQAGSGDEVTGSTTGELEPLPAIGAHAVTPDYAAVNALLAVTVTAEHVDGVRMQIDDGEPVELVQSSPGEFFGEVPAFTGFDNEKYVATLTPWRGDIVGESVAMDYVIALPPPGYERYWESDDLSVNGFVAAVDVLPDGRPVEFGTWQDNGTARCFLRLREKNGDLVDFLPVLPTSQCRATDLTIDRATGVMHVLLDRKGGEGDVWWVGEIAGWGAGPVNIGVGAVGDSALALAQHPDMVAVCGAKSVATPDERDAFAVLLQPGEPAMERLFDYRPDGKLHRYGETARDCKFAGDSLVLVGDASGWYEGVPLLRDRLAVLEYDVLTDEDNWFTAGPGPGVQSRALAIDVDDQGRYHIAGYTCADECVPDGEVRVYEPGGVLVSQVQLGQLGSLWLGPHDIAWSPAGYAVVALGQEQPGESFVFKVQAVAPGKPEPLWTFIPNDQQGQQLGLAVTVGPFGEVYAGGFGADDHPAFAVIGG